MTTHEVHMPAKGAEKLTPETPIPDDLKITYQFACEPDFVSSWASKKLVKTLIERIALLEQQLAALKAGIAEFVRDRGRHDGEHAPDIRVCAACDAAYVQAEARLDQCVADVTGQPFNGVSSAVTP